MLLKHFSIAVLILFTSMPLVYAIDASDFLVRNSESDNSGMPYRLFVPPNYDSKQSYALILYLHGKGERGSNNTQQLNNRATGAMELIEEPNLSTEEMFMIAPQLSTAVTSWGAAPYRDQVADILDQLSGVNGATAEFNIDLNRIYITGISMGAYGVWNLTNRHTDWYAAAIPLSGGGGAQIGLNMLNIPFWFFHAAPDTVVAVRNSRNLVNTLRSFGGQVIYTEYSVGGHSVNVWSNSYRSPLLFNWMRNQNKSTPIVLIDPYVEISTPETSTSIIITNNTSELDFAGTVGNHVFAINEIHWQQSYGPSGTTIGDNNWSIDNIPVFSGEQLITVTASGPSYVDNLPGVTTFADSIVVQNNAPAPTSGTVITTFNAGGEDYVATSGLTYYIDRNNVGGTTSNSNHSIATTDDDVLYQSSRRGNHHYLFPLTNGFYQVKLHFADTSSTTVGQKFFDVEIEGDLVLDNFDIFAETGAIDTAIVKEFDIEVVDSELKIQFFNGGSGNQAIISAIEISLILIDDVIFANGFD